MPPRKAIQNRSWWLALTISLAAHALFLLLLFVWACWGEVRPSDPGGPFDNVVEASLELDMRLELPGPAALAHVATLTTRPVPAPTPTNTVKPMPKSVTGPAPTGPVRTPAQATAGIASKSAGHGPTVLRVSSNCRRVVFVIDRSLSMGLHGGLEAARREVTASVEALRDDQQFQIVAYNRAWVLLLPDAEAGLARATAANQVQAQKRLADLAAEGRTDHVPALKAALRLEPDVIFWLTDADDFRADEVQAIALYNRRHIPICPVTVLPPTGQPANSPLQTLARMTGGTYAVLSQTPDAARPLP